MRRIITAIQSALGYFVTNVVFRAFPSLRISSTQLQYNIAARMYPNLDYKFINCGYAEPEDLEIDFSEGDNIYRLWKKLYRTIVGEAPLRGADVLEVGSGRGGGSEYIATHFEPTSVTGIDLSRVAVELCQQAYDMPGLSFQEGNACALAFEPESFDVVVNLESSHCYPSQETFFREVVRVLRPGGHFCFSDIMESPEHTARVGKLFEELGLVVIEHDDITEGVVRSLRRIGEDPAFRDAFVRWEAPNKRTNMRLAMVVIENALSDLTSGKEYQRWVLRKPSSEG